MGKQYLDKKFVMDRDLSESKRINSIFQISSEGLLEILARLNSNKHTHIYLREKGFEIYGEFSFENGAFGTDKPIGAIANGSHFGEPSSCLFLATFDYQEGDNRNLVPQFNLTEIVKDYILI